MSFLSILKTIGTTIVGVEKVAAPIAETLLPQFSPLIARLDDLFQRIPNAIVTAETQSPTGGGQLKSDAVASDFAAGLSVTQGVLALEGKTLQYDANALQTAITAQVAAFNAMAAVKASFKIVDLPAAPKP